MYVPLHACSIPPTVFSRASSNDELRDNLLDLLAKYGLGASSAERDIKVCGRMCPVHDGTTYGRARAIELTPPASSMPTAAAASSSFG